MHLIAAARRAIEQSLGARTSDHPLQADAGTEGMRDAVTDVSTTLANGERVFSFGVDPLRIDDTGGGAFDVRTGVQLSDLTPQDFLDLCRTRSLRVGLKLFEASSRSRVLSEFRAVEVTESDRKDTVNARFSIPRDLFADRQCRLAQIDLMYEGKLWFEQVLGAPPFLPIWVERPPREVDVFEYYFSTYAPKGLASR